MKSIRTIRDSRKKTTEQKTATGLPRTRRSLMLLLLFMAAAVLFLAACEPEAQKAFVSAFNSAAQEALDSSASAKPSPSPSVSSSPSPSVSAASPSVQPSTPVQTTGTGSVKKATAVLKPSDSGTLEKAQQSPPQSTSFYTYRDKAQGYIVFSGAAFLESLGNQKDVQIESAELELTKHEYHSAAEMPADVAAFLSGSQSYDMAKIIEYYEKSKENGVTTEPLSAAATKTDKIDVTQSIKNAIKDGLLDTNSQLFIFLALTDKTTEHSAEWFGVQSDAPPKLTVNYTAKK